MPLATVVATPDSGKVRPMQYPPEPGLTQGDIALACKAQEAFAGEKWPGGKVLYPYGHDSGFLPGPGKLRNLFVLPLSPMIQWGLICGCSEKKTGKCKKSCSPFVYK